MNQLSNQASSSEPQNGARMDALDLLTFLGWWGGLVAIIVGFAISFFLFGYSVIYWRNADMDLVVVYNAFVLNAGGPQNYFDHPAYFTILATKLWFQFLHAIGLLNIYSLWDVPSAADAPAFDAAMTHAVRAGRILAWLAATGFTLAFTALLRLVVRDWRIVLIAVFAFAFSGGVAVHERILRSELVAACPVLFALMILIVVGRRASVTRPLAVAAAAGLCVLGLENKVQAILLIAAIPLLILPFGTERSRSLPLWNNTPGAWLAAAAATAATAIAGWLAWPLLMTGLDRDLLEATDIHSLLFGYFGIYQAVIVLMICGCMIAYALIWRISAAETLTSILAVFAGASIALLALNLQYNSNNVVAVINPLEKMLAFADASTDGAASGSGLSGFLLLVLHGLGSVLARYTFVLHSSPRPTVFLIWLIIPGIIHAWRHNERQLAVQALLLLLAATGIDTLGVLRDLKSEYFIFTDPMIILAGAILLDRMKYLSLRRWACPIAIVLFGLHLFVSQSEPVKAAYARSGPERMCEWNMFYLQLLPLPWCDNPPIQP